MAYIERTLTLAARDLQGVPLSGILRVKALGLRTSNPTLIGGGERIYPIINGELPSDITIVGGMRYEFTFYEIAGTRPTLPPFSAVIDETSGAVSINELYRQANGSPPDPTLNPLYDGDDAGRLSYGDGEEGDVWTLQGDGTMVLQTPASGGGGGTPASHASTHATGGSDPIAPGSIGAATAQALTDEATARAAADATLTTAVGGKANTSHTHAQSDVTGLTSALAGKAAATHTHIITDVTGLRDELDALASGSELPPGPLAHWRSVRGPGARMLWVADSLGIGASTPRYATDGMPAKLAASMQDTYCGGRRVSISRPSFMSKPFLESEASHFSPDIDPDVDVDPGIIGMTAYRTGPGAKWLRAIPGNPGIRIRQFHMRGTMAVGVYAIFNNGFFYKGGNLDWYVDGVLKLSIDTSIDPATGLASTRHAAIAQIIARDLSDDEHTVEVRFTSSAANLTAGVFGVRMYDPLSISLDNCSFHDARTDAWGNHVPDEDMIDGNFGGYGQPGLLSCGPDLEFYDENGDPIYDENGDPIGEDDLSYDLIVYACGINNILASGYTLEGTRLDILRFLRGAYDPASPHRNASLMMVLPGSDETIPGSGVPRADMANLYREIAEQFGGVFVDLMTDPVQYEWAAYFDAVLGAAAGSPHILDADPYNRRLVAAATA